ncbi:hypothetical protein [Lachnotalea glycerini]|nr:hypothetical protein [Lachnotalea glycerini]
MPGLIKVVRLAKVSNPGCLIPEAAIRALPKLARPRKRSIT